MGRLRIAVVYDIWWPTPDDERTAPARQKGGKKKRRKEVHQEVYAALKRRGHRPVYQVIDGETENLLALARNGADLYFNLSESYAGDDTKEMHIAAYLELLGRHFTGTGPQGLHLAQDKALAKKILAFHGVRTPAFATVYRDRIGWAHDIRFPLIVKPAFEDGSIGIGCSAVVSGVKELMERIQAVHERFNSPALVEEYIEGREIYVGVLGNGEPEALPLVEVDLSELPEGAPRIAGTEVKWHKDTTLYDSVRVVCPDDLDRETVSALQEAAITAFRALKLRDYGRIDFRLAADGTVHFLEANPNPWLSSTAEFALAARRAGRSHTELINEIVTHSLSRS